MKDTELIDAKKVDEAIKEIVSNNNEVAESLLLSVIANTPNDYSNVSEDENGLCIKFWDQLEFSQYASWSKKKGVEKNIKWISNAYPRAYYFLGFLYVKLKRYDSALEMLDKGLLLEPTNPKFKCEKAQALTYAGRKEESLLLYKDISEIGLYVSTFNLATAWRGRGFVLTEMNRLDEAENAYKISLQFEPENKNALNELQYIEHLRGGGKTTTPEATPNSNSYLLVCAYCGKSIKKGYSVPPNNNQSFICSKCQSKLTRKWWQFWR